MSSVDDREILQKLEDIGGDVEARELAHHLGRDSVFGAYQLVEDGLLESKTFFTLTDRGREHITSPSPEGLSHSPHPAESRAGSPAPGPGGAGDDLPPTGFAACHGRTG